MLPPPSSTGSCPCRASDNDLSLRARDEPHSRQLVEQPLRVRQVKRVEALGEPAKDGTEKIAGLLLFTQIAPQTCSSPCAAPRTLPAWRQPLLGFTKLVPGIRTLGMSDRWRPDHQNNRETPPMVSVGARSSTSTPNSDLAPFPWGVFSWFLGPNVRISVVRLGRTMAGEIATLMSGARPGSRSSSNSLSPLTA
jgi:hypothetical protein